jgi:glycosyltransferase involved in cell wall biosynthesis
MSKKPQVSIGLPVYNGESHLRQALGSLLAQKWSDFELIISDNGSTDTTMQICREYAAQDQRIKYHRYEINHGMVWNFNNVFKLASADYFMWAAHDDYWDPLYLQTCMEALNQSNTIILAGTACDSVDAGTSQIILTDCGMTTVGLKPADRFRYNKQVLHSGKSIGILFYGLYRRKFLAEAMPLENIMTPDHTLLAKMSLLGEFFTSENRFMKKKWGGASVSLEKLARGLCITNPLTIHSLYLIREVVLQRIIFISDRLTFLDKIRLSCWSLGNYLFLCLRLRYRVVRDFIKSTLVLGYKWINISSIRE